MIHDDNEEVTGPRRECCGPFNYHRGRMAMSLFDMATRLREIGFRVDEWDKIGIIDRATVEIIWHEANCCLSMLLTLPDGSEIGCTIDEIWGIESRPSLKLVHSKKDEKP